MQQGPERAKRALVLSGGGGRGAYHVGVLHYLELEYFSNRDPGGLRLEHVLASFSIPLWYGPMEVDGVPYWDGGVLANTPFRKALDAMLTETVWRDYLLYKMEREAGHYPDLEWLAIVAPNHYLTVGLMTHYQLEYHQQLFDLGYWDARNDLAAVLPLPGDS